jgi:CubicO group peptidase (beta-lactamase class C family)
MRTVVSCAALALLALSASIPAADTTPAAGSAAELAGLWRAKQRFGPDERGTLIIERTSTGWIADFLGRRIAVRHQDGILDFALPAGRGSFRARLTGNGGLSGGQWFQPPSQVAAAYGTNIVFHPDGQRRWRGQVRPWDDHFTLYLMVERRTDGTIAAFIRNPERSIGRDLGVEQLERKGDEVRLIGRRSGRGEPGVAMSGSYDRERDVLRLYLPDRGVSFDFHREDDNSDFWPRGRQPGRYAYQPPVQSDDGWPVGTLDQANMDRRGIESFIQWILDTPMDSANAPEVRGILVARHGRLVVEEYFHGYDRDQLFDTRSAAKSLTATLIGAALHSGLPVKLNDAVYRVMNGGEFPAGLEPRKRAMTLEHVLTMTSGIHCDDGNPNSPGREDRILDQTDEPDSWRFYLSMPMDREPGERAIYCSGDSNLAIGVLTHATGEHAMDLFDRLLGKPLGIPRHAWFLTRSLQPYGGGSVQMRSRDFMKMGQLMLNGGTWNGKRVLSQAYARRASATLCPLNRIGYGYQWWNTRFPFKDRQVYGYWAGGNGGQGVLVVPELDLVIATFGGSYNTRVGLEIQQGYPARYIIPAVREAGDNPGASTAPKEYEVIYGLQRPAPLCSLPAQPLLR